MQPEVAAGAVRLRPWREDDADAVLAALLDADTRLWNAGWVTTREDAVSWLERRRRLGALLPGLSLERACCLWYWSPDCILQMDS